MAKRVRDSADIQSDIDEVTKRVDDVEAQVEQTEAAVEQATQDRNFARAKLREIAKKLKRLNLCEQERSALVADQQSCVADLTAAENVVERLSKDKEQLREEKLQLREKELQLRAEKLQLREEKQQGASAAGPGVGSAPGAGPTLDALWSSIMARLRAVRELPVGSGVLTFKSGLPVDPTYSSVYIRACYGPLFEELITSNYKNMIITGTPGIGKSCFVYYLVGMLVSLPEPPPYILLEHLTLDDEMLCYDHALGQVLSGTRKDFKAQRNHPKALYISYGIAPNMSSRARIILITLPRRATYKEMEKSGARILYMPLWSLEELLDCHAKVYASKVPEGLAERLYEHYGGVARYVLGVPSLAKLTAAADLDSLLQPLLQPLIKALDASSPAQVQAGLGGLEMGPEASHSLLHIVTKGNFELSHLYFASPFVGNAIVARALKGGLNGLATMMVGTHGAIRGYLFEQVMHRLMPQGGAFRVVPISSDKTLSRAGPETDLELPSCTSLSFKDTQDIWADGDFHENVYFMPVQANFPVDSVLLVGKTLYLFLMTVADSKTVSATALPSIFTQLGVEKLENVDLCLYYVVPPDILNDFQLRADASWPPGNQQLLAARTRLFLLKGDAEAARLLPQQQAGVNRQKPAATVAAARPVAMMVAPVAKRAAAPSSGRVRRVGGQLLAFWR